MNKTIKINISKDAILFDAMNITYLVGRAVEGTAPDSYAAVSYMTATEDENEKQQLRRSIKNADAVIRAEFAEYMTSEQTAGDDELRFDIEGDKYTYSLSVPSNFANVVIDEIAEQIHKYIVNTAVTEWFTLTNRAAAPDYAAQAATALMRLQLILCRRTRPTRPTTIVFNPTGKTVYEYTKNNGSEVATN